jgi:predicted PurR-regulated permease PerM
LVVLFVGIFFAAAPGTYVSGLLHLFPKARREPTREILEKIGCTLRYWLVGQITAMVIVGLVTWAGLALLGVRLAVGLGVLAGLLEFIPTVGPILSGVPAVLIALLDSPQKALYVALLYMGIQFAENHLLTPLVQRRAVDLPPALTVLALLLLATLFGFLGLLFAVPVTAALFVLVQEAYVKRTLKDPLK